MSATVQQLIDSSLRLVHVLATGETSATDPQLSADSLFVFQSMIDAWQAEQLLIFNIPRILFSLTAGVQTYNYGLNPPNPWDFNAPRPAKIDRMGIIWLGNVGQPLELPMQYLTVAQWQEIPVKNITSSLPQYCWDDQNYPFRGLNFWPIPNVNDQIAVYPWTALSAPVSLTTVLDYPPAYQQAIRYNLGVMLAAEFPPVPEQVITVVTAVASQTKALIKTMNHPLIDLRCDPAVTPLGNKYLYNWISDMPAGR
jgi:hypothetical protein